MPQTDDQLLAFDTSDLEDRDEDRARAALGGRHGALYRNGRVSQTGLPPPPRPGLTRR